MTIHQKIEIKNSLKQEILTLENEITTLEKLLDPIKKDCTLDDAAFQTLKQEQEVTFSRYTLTQERLHRLKSTVTKIDTKDYGICMECEEEITLGRLKLIPESLYCISCMNDRERSLH